MNFQVPLRNCRFPGDFSNAIKTIETRSRLESRSSMGGGPLMLMVWVHKFFAEAQCKNSINWCMSKHGYKENRGDRNSMMFCS